MRAALKSRDNYQNNIILYNAMFGILKNIC